MQKGELEDGDRNQDDPPRDQQAAETGREMPAAEADEQQGQERYRRQGDIHGQEGARQQD